MSAAVSIERLLPVKTGKFTFQELLATKSYSKVSKCLKLYMDSSGMQRGAVTLYWSIYDASLSNHRNRKNLSCVLTREQLGKRIDRTVKTITRLTKYLERVGFLSIKKVYLSGGNYINEYFPIVPPEVIEILRQAPNRNRLKVVHTNEASNNHPRDISKSLNKRSNINNNNTYKDGGSRAMGGIQSLGELSVASVQQMKERKVESVGLDALSVQVEKNSPIKIVTGNSLITHPIGFRTKEHCFSGDLPLQEVESNKILHRIEDNFQNQILTQEKLINQKNKLLHESRSAMTQEKLKQSPNLELFFEENAKVNVLRKDIDSIFEGIKRIKGFMANKIGMAWIVSLVISHRFFAKALSSYRSFLTTPNKEASDKLLFQLDLMKGQLRLDQANAKRAIVLGDMYSLGHDFPMEAPRIPKNLLLHAFSRISELVESESVLDVFNQVVASVRFGELSRCKDEKGYSSPSKGFNVAFKLLREGRWVAPECLGKLDTMIEAYPLSFVYEGVELFAEPSLEVKAEEPEEALKAFVKAQRGQWLQGLTEDQKHQMRAETGIGNDFMASMTWFSKHIEPGLKARYQGACL